MDHRVFMVFVHVGFGFLSCSHAYLREYHYVDLLMTWPNAQKYCREKYTNVATFESMDDIKMLQRPDNSTSPSWIGLSDYPESWKGTLGSDSNSWRWSVTGKTSTTTYHNWAVDQPDNANGKEFCVTMRTDATWSDDNCAITRPFVCYTVDSVSGQRTYTVIPNLMTWNNAQAYCRAHHTDLAMIDNALQNEEIFSQASAVNVWIGLYRVAWIWSDMSTSTFRNWVSKEPNNLGGKQYCAAESSSHFWYDHNCDIKLSFWCQEGPKLMVTMIKMKIQTDADLSDPAVNDLILQKLSAVLKDATLADIKLKWKIQPMKEKEKTKANTASHCD